MDLCAVFHLRPGSRSAERLSREELARLESFLSKANVRLRDDEGALAKFTALRALYEPQVGALSRFLLMPLPSWVPSAETRDNWERTAEVLTGVVPR